MKRIAIISSVIAGAMAVTALLPVASADAATLPPPPPPAKVHVVVVKPAPYYPYPYYRPVHPAVAYGVGYATGHYVATHPKVY